MSSKKDEISTKKVVRYSEAFKLKVVSEIESGALLVNEARLKYDIRGGQTIQNWIKKLGKNHLLCRVVRIESPMDINQIKLLKARIAELERALAQTQLECLQSESYLHQACQELGMEVESFKKKEATQSTDRPRVDED